MNLFLNQNIISNYKSNSQIARVLTEAWVLKNIYCLHCGNVNLSEFDNNQPVADFFCSSCNEEFELKSKQNKIGKKIVDGAYDKMIERINADNNPNFFFLTYDKSSYQVKDFLTIPKHYFTNSIIEKRKPLSLSSRRAGWVGCNIIINKIPNDGKIFLVKESKIIDKSLVLKKWEKSFFLREKSKKSRGWIIDILNCLDKIPQIEFTLKQMYSFENELKLKYPNNNHIKDKIRQQLQILRDKGIIEFKSRGNYKKIIQ